MRDLLLAGRYGETWRRGGEGSGEGGGEGCREGGVEGGSKGGGWGVSAYGLGDSRDALGEVSWRCLGGVPLPASGR